MSAPEHIAALQPLQVDPTGVSSTLFGGVVPSGHRCDVLEFSGGAARSHRSRDESAGEQWSEQAVL